MKHSRVNEQTKHHNARSSFSRKKAKFNTFQQGICLFIYFKKNLFCKHKIEIKIQQDMETFS